MTPSDTHDSDGDGGCEEDGDHLTIIIIVIIMSIVIIIPSIAIITIIIVLIITTIAFIQMTSPANPTGTSDCHGQAAGQGDFLGFRVSDS